MVDWWNDSVANMDQEDDLPYVPKTLEKCMVGAYNFESAFRTRPIPQFTLESGDRRMPNVR